MHLPFGPLPEAVAPPSESADVAAAEIRKGSRAPDEQLQAAIADPGRESGFLAIADEAVRASPGDGHVLLLAAVAALLDRQHERALKFLKRFAKRYVLVDAYHLLAGLALAQQDKLALARSVLESHRLANSFRAFLNFPGGAPRRAWLDRELDRIFERRKVPRTRRAAAVPPAARGQARTAPRHGRPPLSAEKTPAVAAPAAQASPIGLPRIEIDIPLSIELALDPLLAAIEAPSADGSDWYDLRERHARLGLAQGFDELLCLPHLRGIESFWYQVETVRKVLKQFRGRVLLADEVGLGKTIEAGMVLKEYMLRGMVENVLVLAPASLVGQWREELREQVRHHLHHHAGRAAAQRSRRLLEREAPDRIAAAGEAERACRAPARAPIRSGHRRRSPPSARPGEPELQAGGFPE